MTPVVPVGRVAATKTTPKKPAKAKVDLTDPKHNPYPNSPSAKFVNGQWMNVVTPKGKEALRKVAATVAKDKKNGGKTAFETWFNSKPTKAAPGDTFDPLAGMPSMTGLTEYPTLPTLPDGSDIPDTPGRTFKPGQAQLLDPNAYASDAQKAYQPVVDALTSTKGRLEGGIPQANDMLDKAYGSAGDSALAGAQVIRQNTAQGNQSLTDLAARMAAAAGGDPTAAAAVGQATANQQSADTRMAGVAEQVQADQAAAASRDLGTAKLGYKSATDKSIADVTGQIGEAKTAGSQAKAKAIMDALGFNSNQQTAQIGRDVAKQEAWLAGQLAGPQITAGQLANEGSRAGLKLNAHNAEVNDWTNINSSKRQQYLDSVTKWTNKNVAQQMKTALEAGKTPAAELALADPKARTAIESDVMGSMLSNAGPLVDPGKMFHSALTTMKQSYPDSSPAAIKKLAQIFVGKQLNAWNSYHAEGQASSGKTWRMVNGSPALVKA